MSVVAELSVHIFDQARKEMLCASVVVTTHPHRVQVFTDIDATRLNQRKPGFELRNNVLSCVRSIFDNDVVLTSNRNFAVLNV